MQHSTIQYNTKCSKTAIISHCFARNNSVQFNTIQHVSTPVRHQYNTINLSVFLSPNINAHGSGYGVGIRSKIRLLQDTEDLRANAPIARITEIRHHLESEGRGDRGGERNVREKRRAKAGKVEKERLIVKEKTHRQTDGRKHTGRQTDRYTDRQTDRYSKTDRRIHRHSKSDRQTDRHSKPDRQTDTDRQIDTVRQTDGYTDTASQTDRQIDTVSQTDKHSKTDRHTDTQTDR
jgi:hypothetical protein